MEKIAETLKGKFNHPELFDLAVQVTKEGQKAGYERLEFLGDRVVGLVVSEMLYANFPNEPEGDLAKRFVVLVCAKTLAKIATLWGLDDIVKNENKQLRHNKNTLADMCEAIMGALYLDCGIEAVKEVMRPTWEPLMMSYEHAPKIINPNCRNGHKRIIRYYPFINYWKKQGWLTCQNLPFLWMPDLIIN